MIRRILTALLVGLALTAALVPATVSAYDPFGSVCTDATKQTSLCQGRGDASQDPLTGRKGLIRGIANILAIVTGIGAVITIIIAGLRYVTSGGDAAKVKGAKDAIIAALIGVVIIALADAIISFVISRV